MKSKEEYSILINDLVNTLIKVFNIEMPINNIENVVIKMGGTIKYIEDTQAEIEIIKRYNSFEFVVPKYENEKNKNFYIARTIGILFMYMGYKIDEILWKSNIDNYKLFKSENHLYKANEFARAFLMPKDLYIEIMDKNSNGDNVYTKEIGNFFNVSTGDVLMRGIDLKLLK